MIQALWTCQFERVTTHRFMSGAIVTDICRVKDETRRETGYNDAASAAGRLTIKLIKIGRQLAHPNVT